MGKPTGKTFLGRSGSEQEGYIRMDLKETDVNVRSWIDSAQGRDYWKIVVNAAWNFRVS